MSLLWFIFIGALAGWLAGRITHGEGFGLIGNIVVGILGAVLGGWLFRYMGIHLSGILGGAFIGPLITAVFGAIILLCVMALFIRK